MTSAGSLLEQVEECHNNRMRHKRYMHIYTCVYVYIYICTHICIYRYTYVYMYI